MTSIELFFAYKFVSILAGVFIVYLGYKLFVVGVYDVQSDLKALWGDKSLVLKKAAPGTLFSLFGAAVISVALVKGINIDTSNNEIPNGVMAAPSSEIVNGLVKSIATTKFDDGLNKELKFAFNKMKNGYALSSHERELVWLWLNLDSDPEADIKEMPSFQYTSRREVLKGSPAPQ